MSMSHLRVNKIRVTVAGVDIGHVQKPDIFLYFTFTNSISYMTEEFLGTSPTDLPPELQNTTPSISNINEVFIQKFSRGMCIYNKKEQDVRMLTALKVGL